MVLAGAAGPPGGARSPLPPRLLSCFHAFFLTPPTHQQLVKIFGTMLRQHLSDFDEETKGVGTFLIYKETFFTVFTTGSSMTNCLI